MTFSRTRKFFIGTPNLARRWMHGLGSILVLSMVSTAFAQEAVVDPTPQFVSDHPEWVLLGTQDWGELGWDVAAHANDKPGEPLRIGARSFAKGIGHHANGAITLLLDDSFVAFDAELGLQPCGAQGSAVFRVMADGEPRFESPVLRSEDPPVAVHVAVGGAMELRLEVTDAGDGISCDMANWANARLTPSLPRRTNAQAQRVNSGQFARVVTWDSNRSDGSRADRIHEFRAEDLFLEQDLSPNEAGRFVVPVNTNQLGCIGLQWLNRRALSELCLAFTDAVRVPPTNAVRVEAWFGESAWQGEFKPLKGDLQRAGNELVFKVSPRADQDRPLLTRKVRWVLPESDSERTVFRPEAYTRSRWAVTDLRLQSTNSSSSATAEVQLENGEWLSPRAAGLLSWKLNESLQAKILYARPSPLKSDPTLIRFRLPDGAFSVAVEDVLRYGSVFMADCGLLITTDPTTNTLRDAQQHVATSPTVLEQVRRMPDQTFAQAMVKTHHTAQSDGPVMLSLACDNSKFVLERDGRLRFNTAIVTDTDWFKDAGELRPEFGGGPAAFASRQLDGGWLPFPKIAFRSSGVTYSERVFVAPCDEPGTNSARLNRPSVCIVEFTLTNEQPAAAEARLSLNFVLNSREKKSASLAKCPQGWLVLGDQSPLALITAPTNGALRASLEGGAISFTGMLAAHTVAQCVAFVRAHDEDLSKLPTVANLLLASETYWNDVLAPALQIDLPDPLLNDIIRASQVRCLIAARNEAEGERVAAWIAAMSYGPLESEAHSVIRSMTFFGHEDFARRSLDFFVHRYNTNGFLTTGYTTFGTAWHLWTAGEHYQLHHDEAWLRAAAPELARVGEWIIRQTDKTAQPAAAYRPEFGLMPPGVIADWNAFAYHFANNAYYYAALRNLGALLAEIHDSRAPRFAARAQLLRENTLRAYYWTQARSPAVRLRNGAWIPHYPSQVHSPGALGDFFPGQDAGRSWCYDVEIGAHQLIPTGVFAAESPEADRMLNHMEDVQFLADGWFDYSAATNQADWFNLGGFSKVQPYYTRNAEIYALRDEIKPFLRSYFNSLAAMLNPEVLTFWEHFNHSGAWDKTHETGYFLHQTRQMLVQERGEELWLAPLITSNWLADGMHITITNAPTQFGPVSYRLTSRLHNDFMEASIQPPLRSAPKAIVLRLRNPEGKKLRTVTVNGKPHTDFNPRQETIRITSLGAATLTLRANY